MPKYMDEAAIPLQLPMLTVWSVSLLLLAHWSTSTILLRAGLCTAWSGQRRTGGCSLEGGRCRCAAVRWTSGLHQGQPVGRHELPREQRRVGREISLDLDMVSAICPACNIVLVEANSSSIANLSTAVTEAASFHPAAITNSYGGTEFSSESAYNSVYSAGAATAITAATGDNGYGTEFPAVSPGVTAVGGTTLSYTGTGSSLAWEPQTGVV